MGVRGALCSRLWARLGSKHAKIASELRKSRRDRKKSEYSKYLESPTWRRIRARVLERDKHKCLACQSRATVVHHIRYPKRLGEERLEWLYSLCAPCHDTIHSIR